MANSTPDQDTCICMFAFQGPPKIIGEDIFPIEISISLAAVEKNQIRKLFPIVHRLKRTTVYLPLQAFRSATHGEQEAVMHKLLMGIEIPFELENIHWGFNIPPDETYPKNNLIFIVSNELSEIARSCAQNNQIGYMNVHIMKLKKMNPDEYQQFCNQAANKSPLYGWIMENRGDANLKPLLGFIVRLGRESPKGNKFYGLRSTRMTSSVECPICIEDIRVNSQAIAMPCSHTFHGFCIMRWLQRMPNCPLCRYQLFAPNPPQIL